ncbi:uncharacterized protein [Macrobrachium rosenbergii]|uniref:uncharacterized protein isoform X1 n=1 Tax=Macrobrachium rosenbergii TaxID=79674 RepID=UPI0034D40F03
MPDPQVTQSMNQTLQPEFPATGTLPAVIPDHSSHSRERSRRWLPWLEPTATLTTLPPLDPLQFLLRKKKKKKKDSLQRRSGQVRKHKGRPNLTFMTKRPNPDQELCDSRTGISAFTVLNFLLAAGNAVSNILNNNNNNNDNNNNNNALNLNVNSNNNNANNVNNIDFSGAGPGRRRRHVGEVRGQKAAETPPRAPDAEDDLERKKATEIMMACLLVMDASQALWKTLARASQQEEGLETMDAFRLPRSVVAPENSRLTRDLSDSEKRRRRSKMAGDHGREEAFGTNARDVSHVLLSGKDGGDFFHGNESRSSSFVGRMLSMETKYYLETHPHVSNNNSAVQEMAKISSRTDSRSENGPDNATLSREEDPVAKNASGKHHQLAEREFQVADEDGTSSVLCHSYRQADSFGKLTGLLARVLTEELLLPVYGVPVPEC